MDLRAAPRPQVPPVTERGRFYLALSRRPSWWPRVPSMLGLGLQQALCPLTAPQGLSEALGGHAWPPRGFCSMHRASLLPSFFILWHGQPLEPSFRVHLCRTVNSRFRTGEWSPQWGLWPSASYSHSTPFLLPASWTREEPLFLLCLCPGWESPGLDRWQSG